MTVGGVEGAPDGAPGAAGHAPGPVTQGRFR